MKNLLEATTALSRQEDVQPAMFRELDATELYCPECGEAVPVRKHLLCTFPQGEKYEYRCVHCSEVVGTKICG